MQSLCLLLARFCLAAWVGAVGLFVVTSVREQVEPSFDSTIRDTLALIRFPWYYTFGFALLGTGLVTGLAAVRHPDLTRRRAGVALACIFVALALMIADYFLIYEPLIAMITPPGSVRPSHFVGYHKASRHINEAGAVLSLAAALLLCWPGVRAPAQPQSAA